MSEPKKLSRWQRFRRSRWALLLNAALIPAFVPFSVLWYGIPETFRDLLDAPRFFMDCWEEATWKL